MHVLEARATSLPRWSKTSHSTRPTTRPHHFRLNAQLPFPYRPQKVDLKLERGEALAFSQSAAIGRAHCGVGNIAQYAAMQRSHRIVVPFAGFEFDRSPTLRGSAQGQAQQPSDWRGKLAAAAIVDRFRFPRDIGHFRFPGFQWAASPPTPIRKRRIANASGKPSNTITPSERKQSMNASIDACWVIMPAASP